MTALTEAMIRRIIFPLWARRNHPGLSSYLRKYDQTQFWSPDRIQQLQWAQLQKIVQFAFDRCPFYTKRFKAIGFNPEDLREPDDLLKLPPLTKDDIRQNQTDLLARDLNPASYSDNYTGGSTGSPISFKVSKRRWASRIATTYRHDCWDGWEIGKPRGILWGHPDEKAERKMYRRLRKSLLSPDVLLNTFDVQESALFRFTDELAKKRIEYLEAYSRSLLMFAQFLSDRGIKPPHLKAAITTAECLTKEEREFIHRTLGCPTFDRYGCREFSVIASECGAHQGLHIAGETMLVEFISGERPAQPGEIGEVIITDFFNEAMPFIRYRIGDTGTPIIGPCPCGRGLPRMEMVAGRVTDFIHTPDGKWLSGIAINTYLISQIPGIRQGQIVQDRCNHLGFRLVASDKSKTEAENYIRGKVPKMFGGTMGHSISWVDAIPRETSGKARVTISECFNRHGFGKAALLSGDSYPTGSG